MLATSFTCDFVNEKTWQTCNERAIGDWRHAKINYQQLGKLSNTDKCLESKHNTKGGGGGGGGGGVNW